MARPAKRGLRVLGICLALVVVLVSIALGYWFTSGRRRAVELANGALESLLLGRIEVLHFESVSPWGASGVDARVYDPDGRLVLEAEDVDASVSVVPLLLDLLVGTDEVNVTISDVTIAHARLFLRDGAEGSPSFLDAFTPRPDPPAPSPAPPSAPVLVRIADARLENVWIHGITSATGPVDLGARHVDVDVDVGETDVDLDVGASWSLRSAPVRWARGELDAQLRIDLRDEIEGLAALARLDARLAVDADNRQVEITIDKEGESASSRVVLDGWTATDFAAFGVPFSSPDPTRGELGASGTLSNLEFDARLESGASSAEAEGTVQLDPELALAARLDVRGFRPEHVTPDLETTPIDAEFEIRAANTEAAWHGDARGRIAPFRISGRPVPALELEGRLGAGGLEARVDAPSRAGGTTLEVRTTPLFGPSALEDARVEFDFRSTATDLAALAAVPLRAASSRVAARGSYHLASERLDVRADAQIREGSVGPDARFEQLHFRAELAGTVARPSLEASVWGENLVALGRSFDEIRARTSGHLDRSRADARVTWSHGRATAQADWSLTDGAGASNVSLELEHEARRLALRARRLRAESGRVHFDDLILEGAGRLEASGHVGAQSVELVGSARDLDLARWARAAGVADYEHGGQIDFDADLRLSTARSDGRLSARLARFQIPRPPAVEAAKDKERPSSFSASLDLIGDGRSIVLDAKAYSNEPKRVDGTTDNNLRTELRSRIALGRQRTLFDGPRWLDGVVELGGRGTVDLGVVGPLFLSDLPVALDGLAEVELDARRPVPAAIPEFSSTVRTNGLRVRFERVEKDRTSIRTLEDVDLRLRVRHDPTAPSTELRLSALHRARPLARAEVDVTGSLASLLGPNAETRLAESEWKAKLRVPRRPLRAFPKILGLPDYEGDVAFSASFEGNRARPRGEAKLRVRRVRPNDEVEPIDGNVELEYDGRELAVRAKADHDGKSRLRLDASADFPMEGALRGEAPRQVDGKLELDDFPIELLTGTWNEDLSGSIDAELEARGLGRPHPELGLKTDLSRLRFGRLALARGDVELEMNGNEARTTLDLGGDDWTVQGNGRTDLVYDSAWLPSLGTRQEGEITARRFRLAWLTPIVAESVAELDGRVDLDLRAAQTTRGTSIAANAKLRNGRAHVPALGQELDRVEADLSWEPNGEIHVSRGSFHGLTGRGTFDARAKMDGIHPRRASAELVVGRNERIPLSLEGFGLGEIHGRVRVQAAIDPEPKRLAVRVEIPAFDLRLPEIPSADVQTLDPDPHVNAGVHLDGRRFVTLPLQPVEEPAPPEDPWTIEATISLGSDVWVQQGPTRRVQLGGEVRARVRQELELSGRITLSRGRIELNGRLFDIDEGTVTFQPDDPTNPIVVAEASWTSPDGTIVHARFVGPLESGRLTLRSEPSLSQGEILSLVLFGTTDGLNNLGSGSGGGSTTSQAVAVGGGVATQGLNQALGRLNAIDVSTRINSDASGHARPEVVVQLTSSLSAQIGYSIEAPAPGKSPDRTLLVLELRLVAGHALATTLGDKGTGIVDWTWRYRY